MTVSLPVVAAVLESRTETHCPYCALQCGMTIVQHGNSFEIASRDFPTNQGGLCRKGWTAAELLTAPDRITTPLLRGGPDRRLLPASWDEAIGFVATSLRAIQTRYGRDAVAVFGGGGLTNEKAYTLGKFARVVLKTRNIDYNGRFCMASAAVASQKAFGIDRGLPFPVSDLPGAEVIVVAGGNPAETMPPLVQYLDEQRRRGGRLIVIDPRRSLTAAAGLHLQLVPGSDAALANGLLHVVIRDGLIDREYIATRTRGFERVEKSVASYWPDRVERLTGVPAASVVEAARLLGRARTAIVLSGRGPEQQSQGVDNVLALTNLALALGLPGKSHSGFGCLTGQGNGQGGREHGQKSDQLPGYRKLQDQRDRQHVAAIWGVDADDLPAPGLPAVDLFARLGERGGVHALLVMGANPVVSAPKAGALEERIQKLDLLVVCDTFVTETASLADVVLPVPHWAEDEGTMTNLEGRVLYRKRAMDPPAGVRSDLEVMKLLATALGRGDYIDDSPARVFDELRRASSGGTADYAGITYSRILAEQGLFWPCPSDDHPGTPRLFSERFPTPDGLARFYPVEQRAPAEEPDQEYPLYLTTGRVLSQYQSGAQTRRVPSLVAAEPEPFVEMHPVLAASLGIAQGEHVCVVTRRGRAYCQARLTPTIRLDTVFMPFHWAGAGRANTLTNDAVDPLSKIPEFKVAASRVERVPSTDEGRSRPSAEANARGKQ